MRPIILNRQHSETPGSIRIKRQKNHTRPPDSMYFFAVKFRTADAGSQKPPRSFSGIEAAVFVLSPLPLIFVFIDTCGIFPGTAQKIFGYSAAAATAFSAVVWHKKRALSNALMLYTIIGTVLAGIRQFVTHPSAVLLFNLLLAWFILYRLFPGRAPYHQGRQHSGIWRHRICWAAAAGGIAAILVSPSIPGSLSASGYFRPLTYILFMTVMLRYAFVIRSFVPVTLLTAAGGITVFLHATKLILHDGIVYGTIYLGVFLHFIRSLDGMHHREDRWSLVTSQPARVLLLSFLLLSAAGTMLLLLPFVTPSGRHVQLIDAAFTSVSAVCVTGLTVLDTSLDFSPFGQFVILLLIQAGGLGIMTITAVAVYAIGHRMSLQQERILTEITDSGHADLLRSITTIVKFTMIAEGAGALLLTLFFHLQNDPPAQALWRGVFTSVSAFCNAGFSLQSESLVPYRNNPFVLNTVALLIIAGGMAPATFLALPVLLKRRSIAVSAAVPLVATAVLLVSGTLMCLAFEWRGMLDGFSWAGKLDNAWFQSVTLRTAGFNSVDLSAASAPTLLFMILYMFIGGSPGGTAGGVKTAVAGVLALTFWSTVSNRRDIQAGNRRIMTETVFKAVTIVISGCIVWLCTVVMLMATQQIPVRDLVFEAMSALGTVGLSTGATAGLDEPGKTIIMIAMFAGRVGPMTLFMFLGGRQLRSGPQSPDVYIPLT